MNDTDPTPYNSRFNRRNFLRLGFGAVVGGLAGCAIDKGVPATPTKTEDPITVPTPNTRPTAPELTPEERAAFEWSKQASEELASKDLPVTYKYFLEMTNVKNIDPQDPVRSFTEIMYRIRNAAIAINLTQADLAPYYGPDGIITAVGDAKYRNDAKRRSSSALGSKGAAGFTDKDATPPEIYLLGDACRYIFTSQHAIENTSDATSFEQYRIVEMPDLDKAQAYSSDNKPLSPEEFYQAIANGHPGIYTTVPVKTISNFKSSFAVEHNNRYSNSSVVPFKDPSQVETTVLGIVRSRIISPYSSEDRYFRFDNTKPQPYSGS